MGIFFSGLFEFYNVTSRNGKQMISNESLCPFPNPKRVNKDLEYAQDLAYFTKEIFTMLRLFGLVTHTARRFCMHSIVPNLPHAYTHTQARTHTHKSIQMPILPPTERVLFSSFSEWKDEVAITELQQKWKDIFWVSIVKWKFSVSHSTLQNLCSFLWHNEKKFTVECSPCLGYILCLRDTLRQVRAERGWENLLANNSAKQQE